MIPRLVSAPISLVYSVASSQSELFEREFQQLSDSDDNPINQWLKLAKARGETSDTDPVLLQLIVELHNKIDSLEQFLKNEQPSRVSLNQDVHIDSIGFEHFNIAEDILDVGVEYYGRIEMPVHPKRDVAVYFVAESKTLCKIVKMHERDEKEWGSYLTARERILIRAAKEKK